MNSVNARGSKTCTEQDEFGEAFLFHGSHHRSAKEFRLGLRWGRGRRRVPSDASTSLNATRNLVIPIMQHVTALVEPSRVSSTALRAIWLGGARQDGV